MPRRRTIRGQRRLPACRPAWTRLTDGPLPRPEVRSHTMNFTLAFRRLRAAPGFTLAAAVTLALGIGANALAFSAIRALLVEPLPFADGDDLVWLQGANA